MDTLIYTWQVTPYTTRQCMSYCAMRPACEVFIDDMQSLDAVEDIPAGSTRGSVIQNSSSIADGQRVVYGNTLRRSWLA